MIADIRLFDKIACSLAPVPEISIRLQQRVRGAVARLTRLYGSADPTKLHYVFAKWLSVHQEERQMPFDGTNDPFGEPKRDRHRTSSRVQRALRGWRPIEHCGRGWLWTIKEGAFLHLLRHARHGAYRRPR